MKTTFTALVLVGLLCALGAGWLFRLPSAAERAAQVRIRTAESICRLASLAADIATAAATDHRQKLSTSSDLRVQQVDANYQIAIPHSAVGRLDRQAAAAREKIQVLEDLIPALKQAGQGEELAFKQLQEAKGVVILVTREYLALVEARKLRAWAAAGGAGASWAGAFCFAILILIAPAPPARAGRPLRNR